MQEGNRRSFRRAKRDVRMTVRVGGGFIVGFGMGGCRRLSERL
jgi:hypothetical protein